MSKAQPPSRRELLDTQLVLKLLGDLATKYNIERDDIDSFIRRARDLWPKYHREVILDEAVRRSIAASLTSFGVAFDDFAETLKSAAAQSFGLSRDDPKRARLEEVISRRLNVLGMEMRSTIHSSFRGLQDAVSGIMELMLREHETSLRAEMTTLLAGVFGAKDKGCQTDEEV